MVCLGGAADRGYSRARWRAADRAGALPMERGTRPGVDGGRFPWTLTGGRLYADGRGPSAAKGGYPPRVPAPL